MKIEDKIFSLVVRKTMLENKGAQNAALVKKVERQIRKYKNMLENN